MAWKFSESHKSLKHELGVNLKILFAVCYPYLAGTLVASWYLVQEVVCLNNFLNIILFVTEFSNKI